MNKSLRDQLNDWKRKNFKPISDEKRHPNTKRPKIQKEQTQTNSERFSEKELADLMGTNMKTLRRGRGGAYK